MDGKSNSNQPQNSEELMKQFQELREQNLRLTEKLKSLTLKSGAENNTQPTASAPPASAALDYKYIKELLSEIRDYDGSTHPEHFIKSTKRALSKLRDDEERDSFARKLIAQKIKGAAQVIADRVPSQD